MTAKTLQEAEMELRELISERDAAIFRGEHPSVVSAIVQRILQKNEEIRKEAAEEELQQEQLEENLAANTFIDAYQFINKYSGLNERINTSLNKQKEVLKNIFNQQEKEQFFGKENTTKKEEKVVHDILEERKSNLNKALEDINESLETLKKVYEGQDPQTVDDKMNNIISASFDEALGCNADRLREIKNSILADENLKTPEDRCKALMKAIQSEANVQEFQDNFKQTLADKVDDETRAIIPNAKAIASLQETLGGASLTESDFQYLIIKQQEIFSESYNCIEYSNERVECSVGLCAFASCSDQPGNQILSSLEQTFKNVTDLNSPEMIAMRNISAQLTGVKLSEVQTFSGCSATPSVLAVDSTVSR